MNPLGCRYNNAIEKGSLVGSGETSKKQDLIIVGGGFSGLCTATMAAQKNPELSIAIFDDSEQLGLGIAYATTDPDHRLNGPAVVHSMEPADLLHLSRWCHENEIVDDDPDAVTRYGLFIRRSDYAKYMQAFLPKHVTHIRAKIKSLEPGANHGCTVTSTDGQTHHAKAVVLAVGNPPQHIPAPMQAYAEHPAIITNPWDRSAIAAINAKASVLIIGASLTAADQICSLLGQGHLGPIQVISRHGLRPTQWPLPTKDAQLPDIEAVINDPPESWITDTLNEAATVRNLTRAVRSRIKQSKEKHETWELAFDEVRNKVWQIWPQFSATEKKRFLRRLRPYYDVYRFRIPPQTAQTLADAENSGQLSFRRASLIDIAVVDNAISASLKHKSQLSSEAFDVVINCTGFDLSARPAPDTLCGGLVQSGHLSPDPCGVGFQTDQNARCIDLSGNGQKSLRMVGPQTAGTWGDPLSAVFIGFQVRRMMPDLMATLNAR